MPGFHLQDCQLGLVAAQGGEAGGPALKFIPPAEGMAQYLGAVTSLKFIPPAEEMAQYLGAVTTLIEDPSSVPIIYIRRLETTSNFSSKGTNTLLASVDTHEHMTYNKVSG